MDIDTFRKAAPLFECTMSSSNTASKDWERVFIKRSDDCSIGRASFEKGQLKAFKSYKKDYRRDICETDYVMMRLSRWMKDGKITTREEFEKMVHEAHEVSKRDFEEKKKWREEHNFKKKRPKLVGKNPRRILYQLVLEAPETKMKIEFKKHRLTLSRYKDNSTEGPLLQGEVSVFVDGANAGSFIIRKIDHYEWWAISLKLHKFAPGLKLTESNTEDECLTKVKEVITKAYNKVGIPLYPADI